MSIGYYNAVLRVAELPVAEKIPYFIKEGPHPDYGRVDKKVLEGLLEEREKGIDFLREGINDCLHAFTNGLFKRRKIKREHIDDLLEGDILGHRELYRAMGFILNYKDPTKNNKNDPIPATYNTTTFEPVTRKEKRKEVVVHKAGPAPFGYQKSDTPPYLVPLKEQADIVKAIFELYIQKGSRFGSVIDYLNERGILSPKGMKWTRAGISNILKREMYAGNALYGGEPVEGLVTPELFERVKLKMEKNNRRGGKKREKRPSQR